MSDRDSVEGGGQPRASAVSEDAGGGAGARSLSPKARWLLPLAVLIVVGVIAAIGGLLWASYTRSPEYSLEQMARAANARDWDGVLRYLDVDSVASHFADVTLANAGTDGTIGGGTAMGGSASRPGVQGPNMKQVFVERFRDSLRASIEGTLAAGSGGVPAFLVARKPKHVTYVSETEALVTVEVPLDAGGTQDIGFRMVRADERWRITALENVGDLQGLLR